MQWTKTPYNDASWMNYDVKTGIALDADERLYFRGKRTHAFGGNTEGASNGKLLDTTGPYAVYGELMALYCDENYVPKTTAPTYTTAFANAFYGDDNLRTIPGKTLTITITSGTPGESCFRWMFKGCDNITESPVAELVAPALSVHCYWNMFQDCTSLTSGPVLNSITTLGTACFEEMFRGCTSLTEAPELPWTTLTTYCYNKMFYGCTSLKTAPDLPASTLTNYCYNEMFRDCSRLQSITCLATSGINSNNSTTNWVNGVSASGTFTAASGASWPSGNNGIPSGWTVLP